MFYYLKIILHNADCYFVMAKGELTKDCGQALQLGLDKNLHLVVESLERDIATKYDIDIDDVQIYLELC